MKRTRIIILFVCFLLSNSFAQSQATIKILPLNKPESEFGFLGFEISASWMDGCVVLRFPETLESENGLYFIDHNRLDKPPLSKMSEYPDWNVNESTGEISYSYTTPEGIEFGGFAKPSGDEVLIEFYVKNHTDNCINNIVPQMCLTLQRSNSFNESNTTSGVYIWSGSEYFPLDKSTPSPDEIGREPLFDILRRGFDDFKPGTDFGKWWSINQTSDEDIIVRESKDRKHLIAISWPGEVSSLVYNSLIPCIHAGPTIKHTIDARKERHWYGTIYLMENNPQKLLEKYKSGKRYN